MTTSSGVGNDTMLPGFATTTCITVECITCHTTYGGEDIESWHFASYTEAMTAVSNPEDSGWWLTSEGPQCCDCAGRQACADLGHAWDSWGPCLCGCARGEPHVRTHTEPWLWRVCQSCNRSERKPA